MTKLQVLSQDNLKDVGDIEA